MRSQEELNTAIKFDEDMKKFCELVGDKPVVIAWENQHGAITTMNGKFEVKGLALAKHVIVKRINKTLDTAMQID